MGRIRPLSPALLPILCLLACMPSHAFYLGGSFSGTAEADTLPLGFTPPRPESYYDGAPVTGSFVFDVPDPTYVSGDGSTYAYYDNGNGGSMSVSYTIKDAHFDYVANPSVILLQAAGSASAMESVLFLTTFMPKYEGATFGLQGAAGSLFDGVDVTTLHVDPAALPVFSTDFANAAAEMHIAVTLDAVSFQTTPPVPEPASASLFLIGAMSLLWQRHHRDRRQDGWPARA